jgi:uncharacterized membrane protein YcaP (DUF421 family)
MGKRQIGEMQPFEFIITLIIADLACIPMTEVSIPLVYGIVSIACLFILHQLLSILEQRGKLFKRIISGKPSIVINQNGVDMLELKKNNLSVDDLIETMRSLGYFSLDDAYYAIYESNGKLSTLENQNKTQKSSFLPLLIIDDGKIIKNNLSLIKSKLEDINNFLQQSNAKLKDVEVLTIDGNGRAYLKIKKQKYAIKTFTLKEGVQW